MVTIKEIAKACKVSVATVSNIINDKPGASAETRKLVLDKIEELHYTPNSVAKNLKKQSTESIGVIAEDMTIFSIPDIIDGITDSCEKHGYQILLVNLRLFKKYNDTYYANDNYFDVVENAVKELLSKQVEGIIYVAAHERIIHCLPQQLKIPAIMAYGYSRRTDVPSIVVDDVQGAYDLICYATQMGHEKIGIITGKQDSFHMQARLVGYQKAMLEAQIYCDASLICYGDWSREAGHDNTDYLLDKGVTAIFCMNDLMAGGVYDRLEERGMMPGRDITVMGYDNREVSGYYKPPLTTVNLPLHDIGYCANEVIMGMLGKNEDSQFKPVYQIPCKLEIRESVAKITK